MPRQLECADCRMKGGPAALKPSFLRSGQWICKDRAACELRIMLRIRKRRES